MATLVLGILLALQTSNPAVQQRATRTWDQAYDAAVKDIAGGRWQSAINNLQEAVKLGPKPARNAFTDAKVPVKFVPDYYLGIAYLNLKQYVEADAAFQKVQRSGLIGPKDAESSAFTLQAATAAFEHAIAGAGQAFEARQLDAARKQAEAAKGKARGVNVARADDLIKRIDNAIQAAAGAANVNAPPLTPAPQVPQRLAAPNVPPVASGPPSAAEDAAIAPFFAGDYAAAFAGLQSLIARNAASPRVYFYLACSNVALVFTGGASEASLKEAQAAMTSAGNPSQFAADLRFISPRILKRLGV